MPPGQAEQLELFEPGPGSSPALENPSPAGQPGCASEQPDGPKGSPPAPQVRKARSKRRLHGNSPAAGSRPASREAEGIELSLLGEIETLRTIQSWLLEQARQGRAVEDAVHLLDVVGRTALRIARLLESQQGLQDSEPEPEAPPQAPPP